MNAKTNNVMQRLQSVIQTIEGFGPEEILDILTTYINEPPKTRLSFPITLDAAGAALLSAINTNNRNLSETRLRVLCRSLHRDEFKHTHQGIAVAVDENGASVLLDGQKRIAAVLRTGHSIRVDITFGLDTTVFGAIDTVQPRALAQTMARESGTPNAIQVASAMNVVARICANTNAKLGSTADLQDWLAPFEADLEWAMGTFGTLKGFRIAELIAAMTTAHRLYPEQAEAFMQQVITGANLKLHDPALTLRNVLPTIQVRRTGGANSPLIAQVVFNAFAAYLDNVKIQRASTSTVGLTRFRKELQAVKKIRDLVKFWGTVGAPAQAPEQMPLGSAA